MNRIVRLARLLRWLRLKRIVRLARLAPARQPRLVAVAVGVAIVGLLWLMSGHRRTLREGLQATQQASHSDARYRESVAPAWPKYLPRPDSIRLADFTPGSGPIVIPAVVRGPIESVSERLPAVDSPEPNSPARPSSSGISQQQASIAQNAPAIGPPRFTIPIIAPPRMASLPQAGPVRSEAMEKIARQADQKIRQGFELAGRGAYFSARSEFTAALRLVAQGLDGEQNTPLHGQALGIALTAMKEAQDFIPANGKLESELDLAAIVGSHRTPVLKNVPVAEIQPMRALNRYLTFAQEQLAIAEGREVAGSMALLALGKMHATLAAKGGNEIPAPDAKAVVCFHAAILVCPRNYMASNDLGVLLARNGDYSGARTVLEHSVLAHRCSENLQNLSFVYGRVGERRLAGLATQKAQSAREQEVAELKNANLLGGGAVQWVDPSALAQSSETWPNAIATAKPASGTANAAAARQGDRPVVGTLPWPLGPAASR